MKQTHPMIRPSQMFISTKLLPSIDDFSRLFFIVDRSNVLRTFIMRNEYENWHQDKLLILCSKYNFATLPNLLLSIS